VWIERERTKKLTIAFHFLRTDQAGWNCEQCRRQGLEQRRRCGFLPEDKRGPRRPVWVRNRKVAEECPKSLIAAESVELLERFFVWKFSSGRGLDELTAREADAFVLLDGEYRMEEASGR
jgi:hypothetical protein